MKILMKSIKKTLTNDNVTVIILSLTIIDKHDILGDEVLKEGEASGRGWDFRPDSRRFR